MYGYRKKDPWCKGHLPVALLITTILFLILTLTSTNSIADGIGISSNIDYPFLDERGQKGAVVWDDVLAKETLVLSTSFSIKSLADFCWIVPIPSSQDPVIEASDSKVFDTLKDLFTTNIYYPYSYGYGLSQFGGTHSATVEVIDIKEIDVYDLAVLWADDPNDLAVWLTGNGYPVPEGFKTKARRYTNQTNGCYFVANKIDLDNKFAAQLSALEDYAPGIYDDLMAGNLSSWYISWGILNQLKNHIVSDIKDGIAYDSVPFFSYVMSANDYQYLQDDWSNSEISSYNLGLDVNEFISSMGLFENIIDLFDGAGTPLKITFAPPKPLYPLYLTSLADNYGEIYVYVLAKYKAKDENQVLSRYDSVSITSSLKTKLGDAGVTLPDSCKYVTFLTYKGNLDDLDDDAVFTEYVEPDRNADTTPFPYPYISPIPNYYNRYYPSIINITPSWISSNLWNRWGSSYRPSYSWPDNFPFSFSNLNYPSTSNSWNWNSWSTPRGWYTNTPSYPSFGYGYRSGSYNYSPLW